MPAYSFVQYSGDGSTGPFVIPFPYLDRTHVTVQVDAVDVAFSFDSDTALSLQAAAASGSVVEIRRATPAAERLVDFTDGSVLTEVDLDTALLQQLYLAQETFDLADTAVTLGSDGVYDFGVRRASSLADPTDAQDAATKAYVDATTPASAAAAASSAAAAATSASSAASSNTAAGASASAAGTAQTAAEAAQAAAEAAAAGFVPVPSGGAIGQVLAKQSGDDGDADWQDVASGIEISEIAGAPDADDDDSNTGGNGAFAVGSQWLNTAASTLYACLDASTGAAVWREMAPPVASTAEAEAGTETEPRLWAPEQIAEAVVALAASAPVAPDVIIEDQKASGTNGGAVNTGYYNTWKKRTLNTEVRDELGVTLSSDEVTLPAGTYYAEAESPGFGANGLRCRIYDETNTAEIALSQSAYSAANTQAWARVCTVFTLASPANISIQHQANYNGSNTANLGFAYSGAGMSEVYTRLKIWRIA